MTRTSRCPDIFPCRRRRNASAQALVRGAFLDRPLPSFCARTTLGNLAPGSQKAIHRIGGTVSNRPTTASIRACALGMFRAPRDAPLASHTVGARMMHLSNQLHNVTHGMASASRRMLIHSGATPRRLQTVAHGIFQQRQSPNSTPHSLPDARAYSRSRAMLRCPPTSLPRP